MIATTMAVMESTNLVFRLKAGMTTSRPQDPRRSSAIFSHPGHCKDLVRSPLAMADALPYPSACCAGFSG